MTFNPQRLLPPASPDAVVFDLCISPSLKSKSCLILASSPGLGMC